MARLFDVSTEFAVLCDQLDAIADDDTLTPGEKSLRMQDIFDALDQTDTDFKDKVLNLAAYIKDLDAQHDALKTHQQQTRRRIISLDRRISRTKDYLRTCLEVAGVRKIEDAQSSVTLRKNPVSVQISDESALVQELEDRKLTDALDYYAPEIKKSVLKDYIKDGYEFANAELASSTSVVIG